MIHRLRQLFLPALALLAVLGTQTPAGAQTTFFGSDDPRGALTNSLAAQQSFLNALISSGTDDLESYTPFAPPPSLTFGATGVTATVNSEMVVDFTGQDFNLAISGTQALLDNGAAAEVFTLSSAVNGFGLFIIQAGDLTNVNTITVTLENTVLGTSKDFNVGTFGPNRSFDSVIFFGVVDFEAFNRVTITESVDGDGTLYDDITAGFAAVPEPSSFVLAGGAGALALYLRRRHVRRQKKRADAA